MTSSSKIRWTNKSVLAFAQDADPVDAIEEAARDLVLRAREHGWDGPPFNPLEIAKMLEAQIEANSSISDARLLDTETGPKIEFNPRQPRERVRFSIAHEVAHLLFSDWHEEIRNRDKQSIAVDGWQLEMLCNIAASEFVLPIGSLPDIPTVPPIEKLMEQRSNYDVSTEAFLLRIARISKEPIGVFFASPMVSENTERTYYIDYCVTSPTAPSLTISGSEVSANSVIHDCIAIGHTARGIEDWILGSAVEIECVGVPSYPGSMYPRVAALVRFDLPNEDRHPINIVNGDVLQPRGDGLKILCQLVNDRARRWGGGIARQMANQYPEAEKEFSFSIVEMPRPHRLGHVIFTRAAENITVASLIAQEGYGPSTYPRIRYSALKQCFEQVTRQAIDEKASIHMPKIGTGAAGGDWATIEEIVEHVMVRAGLSVTIYYPPPSRLQGELF